MPTPTAKEIKQVRDLYAELKSERAVAKHLGRGREWVALRLRMAGTDLQEMRREEKAKKRAEGEAEEARKEELDSLRNRVKELEDGPPIDPVMERQLRTQLKDVKKELRNALDQVASDQKIMKIIHEGTDYDPNPPVWQRKMPPKKKREHLPGTPTLFLSDLHWDEVVDPKEIGGVNAYNRIIAHERMKHTIHTSISMLSNYIHKAEYPGIVMPCGGDMFSGNIHEELAETNEAVLPESLLDLLDCLIWAAKTQADAFGKVYIPWVVGNHGRMHKKPRAKKGPRANWDWLLGQLLKRAFAADDRVHVQVSEAFDLTYKIYDTGFLLTHGDQFRGGSGIAGVLSPLMIGDARKRKRQVAIKQPYDYMIMGHWHQLMWFGRIICNGSMKGYDEYANRSNFGFEPAQQALFITHPTRGINWWMPVLCDEQPDVAKSEWVSWQG